jgi:hypothetical protein
MRFLLFAGLCLCALAASAADYTFTGFARDLHTGELLYVEAHAVRAAGTTDERRVVLYRTREDSTPFARKSLSYGTDRARPLFDFDDRRSGFAESVARDGSDLRVSARSGAAAPARSAILDVSTVGVSDAGFDEVVLVRWAELRRGDALTIPFLVPSRLDTVNFRVRRVGQARIAGEDASVFRLSLAGPLGWFLPDIHVSYRDRDRRLLRYRGLTNIRDAQGTLLEAQIDFPDSGITTGEVDLEALRALPLSTSR